jgi:hypothetical protein
VINVPPLMVAGLPWSDVRWARQALRRLDLKVAATTLIPSRIDAFVAGSGLLVWVLADTATRLRNVEQRRGVSLTIEQTRLLGQKLHKQRQAMFEADWVTIKLDNRAHPGYFFKLAHVVVWNMGDRLGLSELLTQLAQDLAEGLVFAPRQTRTMGHQSAAPVLAGQTHWEMKCYGHPAPEHHPYSSLANFRP